MNHMGLKKHQHRVRREVRIVGLNWRREKRGWQVKHKECRDHYVRGWVPSWGKLLLSWYTNNEGIDVRYIVSSWGANTFYLENMVIHWEDGSQCLHHLGAVNGRGNYYNILAEEWVCIQLILLWVDRENYILEQDRSAVTFDSVCPQSYLEWKYKTWHIVVCYLFHFLQLRRTLRVWPLIYFLPV